MTRVFNVDASLKEGAIATDLPLHEISDRVMNQKQIVILKNAFPASMLGFIKTAVLKWGRETPLAPADDFRGNYHRQRAMVSRLQQAPHVFHDYNFNDMRALSSALEPELRGLFEPLRDLYNGLTGNQTALEIPASGPYVHPQIIHYPSGGGFFGRHWHNLQPQKLGFIVSLSKLGTDYRNGGTQFDIDGEVVDTEGLVEIGDICIWRYDYHHWVTQSDLQDKFDWNSDNGRWVATYAFFDPAS